MDTDVSLRNEIAKIDPVKYLKMMSRDGNLAKRERARRCYGYKHERESRSKRALMKKYAN